MTQANTDETKVEVATGWRRLESFAVLRISGRDALAFAQAQLANDLRALAVHAWQWNCLLNAQGRVIALMQLLRVDDAEIAAILPAASVGMVRDHLVRYVLRSKVTLSIDAGCPLGRVGDGPMPLAPGGEIVAEGPGWRWSIGGERDRALAIGLAADATMDASAWGAADIDDGIPWLVGDAVAAHVPHALGLGALPAFSTSKGCYPGQEIVARTHFLGRNKRRLARYEAIGTQAHAPGTRLLAADAQAADAVGHVVSGIALPGGRVAGLAVVRDDGPAHASIDDAGTPTPVSITAAASREAPQA
jgi:folate-binding protein YgfZ